MVAFFEVLHCKTTCLLIFLLSCIFVLHKLALHVILETGKNKGLEIYIDLLFYSGTNFSIASEHKTKLFLFLHL